MEYCSNDYLLWCPEERKILLIRDIVFNEFKFNLENATFYHDFTDATQEEIWECSAGGEFLPGVVGGGGAPHK